MHNWRWIWVLPDGVPACRCLRRSQVAETITDPDDRAEALTDLAQPLAGLGVMGRARRALAAAWLTGSWLGSVDVLAVCDPKTLRELARDELAK